MPHAYQVTSNGYYFGLQYQGKDVIPCVCNKLWRIAKNLVAFRQDSLFGIYSMLENRILYEPTLCAEVPYFRLINNKEDTLVTRSRFITSNPGVFTKTKEYLETCDFLLWEGDRLLVLSPEGIIVITRNGEIRNYKGKKKEEAVNRLMQRCLYEDEYYSVLTGKLSDFDYLTEADKEIDEENFLGVLVPHKVGPEEENVSEKSECSSDNLEWDEPSYKHYDYTGIPPVIKGKFIRHLNCFFDTATNEKLTRFLIYLAWCHANGFVKYDQKGNCTIDPWYASLPDYIESAGTIDRLYEAHQLKGLQSLLYFSPVTDSYLEVLALLN
ncbi:hypothetical protein [Rufibacter aurantiacus]|uniref:hypothetical protein n=1 Tax=Rufibacter aurantiacus TaxID=2817374 RepID=UPI001B302F23|nr:hypothetical protein [Rufibacter aurantiacus]